ncbi:hypothetical protein [Pseudomonas sp. NA-150]|uniref:hypothetical protein n=1 Tax=Pseudomonas sp. NA-150 TaxID=3367525 RepID=UPI0037C7A113
MMNKQIWRVCGWLFLMGSASSAYATSSTTMTSTIINKTGEDLTLSSADWPFGSYSYQDYAIPRYHKGAFTVKHSSRMEGDAVFTYRAGGKACQFSVGHKPERKTGWLMYSIEPVEWAKAKTVGDVGAICRALIPTRKSEDNYVITFIMG